MIGRKGQVLAANDGQPCIGICGGIFTLCRMVNLRIDEKGKLVHNDGPLDS